MDKQASDSHISMVEKNPRSFLLYTFGALVLGGILLVSMIEVDRVISGRGKTVLQEPRIVLRPSTKSLIKQIHVSVGDRVAKGAAVLTLDPTVSESELNKYLEKVDSYQEEIRRLDAVLKGENPPVEASESNSPHADMLAAELREFKFKIEKYREQEAGLREKAAELSSRLPMLKEQLKIASDIEKMWDDLVNKENYGSRLNWHKATQDRIKAQTQHSETSGELMKTRYELKKVIAEREGYAEEWRVKKMDSRIQAERNLREARQEAAKASFENSSVVLVAPEDAIVVEMSDTAVGTIVSPTDVLMKLIPAKTPSLVDVRVAATDISFISSGMPVDIKLDSAPFQKHGFLHGRLDSITYDSFDKDSESSKGNNKDIESNVSSVSTETEQFYLARIEITDNALKNLPEAFRLMPGMSVEADIKVGQRRLVEYLLFPVMRVVNEGMREP
ncbi:HlyD family type I secretion periplasmic adaptor subunit [Azotobacter chroococcum]|uniref:Membrane fusion protein (MFP) family protein n=1 Tax=Azotobacter chroococcum TaxID=353 RepID=A0AA44C8W0_9GAMM|nr:HlyD family type I secretion periplasmic adaptor subunit [Azotobacter chroococcum]NHN78048.1 HlyD family type I secretion periplasmic adaptor subunit [Azotobacter chroococcum]